MLRPGQPAAACSGWQQPLPALPPGGVLEVAVGLWVGRPLPSGEPPFQVAEPCLASSTSFLRGRTGPWRGTVVRRALGAGAMLCPGCLPVGLGFYGLPRTEMEEILTRLRLPLFPLSCWRCAFHRRIYRSPSTWVIGEPLCCRARVPINFPCLLAHVLTL